MSESMTRGMPLMALQGATMRHDIGTLSMSSALPVKAGQGDPMMVNPHIFAGLLDIGITSIDQVRNALDIRTKTGLSARLPVVVDPHRNMALRIGAGGVEVPPELFVEWLTASVAIAKAMGRAVGSIYTYRSNVFAYNSSVMVAARLSKAWPTPSTANPRLLANILAAVDGCTITSAQCSETEVLVRTDKAKVLRAEAQEEPTPQQPVDMLARFKSHIAPAIQSLPANALRDVVHQLRLVADAFGNVSAAAEVRMCPDAKGLMVRLLDNKVHVPCEHWTLGRLDVPFRSFVTLGAIPNDSSEVHFVSAPSVRPSAPLVLRSGNLSFFMAAAARGE